MVIVRRSAQRSPERVQEEMERVFRSLVPARPHVASSHAGRWRPPIEVYETQEGLVVTAEVAGMEEEALSVVVEHDVLSIRGRRPDTRVGNQRRYREVGIAYGEFGADIFLPFPIDSERASASYENGFLRIELPRVPARTIVPRDVTLPDPGEGGAS
jgi:HSP20 family molecular chaperone IbpA